MTPSVPSARPRLPGIQSSSKLPSDLAPPLKPAHPTDMFFQGGCGLESFSCSKFRPFRRLFIYELFEKTQNPPAPVASLPPTTGNPYAKLSDQEIADAVGKMNDRLFAFEVPTANLTSTSAGTSVDALQGILATSPQILAFGEIHAEVNFGGRTTADIFTREILPTVYIKGYDHLVLEFLPSDFPQKEMNEFMKTGVVDDAGTPFLKEYLKVLDDNGKSCLQILQACRQMKITVLGGGPTIVQLLKIMDGQIAVDKVFEFIRDNSRNALEKQAAAGKKTLFYGGAYHNDVSGRPANAAFGDTLSKKFKYAEVDIIVPGVASDLVRKHQSGTAIHTLKFYSKQIPPKGQIRTVSRSPGAYALVYPIN